MYVLILIKFISFYCRGIRANCTFSFLEVVVSCEIANCDSDFESSVDKTDIKGKKTIYLHLKKFFRGTRFTFKPFLQSLQNKHKVGEIVCVSGKVSFKRFSKVGWLSVHIFVSFYHILVALYIYI